MAKQPMPTDLFTWSNLLPCLAIVLSIASFWNAYMTRGRVVLGPPLGVRLRQGPLISAGQLAPLGWTHIWRMYLFFCCTGAKHPIVSNIRLIVQQDGRRVTVPIAQWVRTVMPQDDEHSLTAAGGDFAGAFAIPPRGTFERAGQFRAPPTTGTLAAGGGLSVHA